MAGGLVRATAACALTRISWVAERLLEALPAQGAGGVAARNFRSVTPAATDMDADTFRREVASLRRADLIAAPARGLIERTKIGDAAVDIVLARRAAAEAPEEAVAPAPGR